MTSKWYESEEEMLEEEQIPVTGSDSDGMSFIKKWGEATAAPSRMPWRVTGILFVGSLLIALLGWVFAKMVEGGWLDVDVSGWLTAPRLGTPALGFWIAAGFIAGLIIMGICRFFGPCGKDD